jgi:long-subunit fatty acid transport protein
MKILNLFYSLIFLITILSIDLFAQGVAQPLTLQNLERYSVIGSRARAMGGGYTAAGNDVTTIFANPAAMSNLSTFEFRFGSSSVLRYYEQNQTWVPDERFVELSLIFENNNPPKVKPFDALTPKWKKYRLSFHPSFAAMSYQFEFSGTKVTAGLGYAEYLNLDQYYQNNNALDPNIGQLRPFPIPKPEQLTDTLKVNWFQFISEREGSVWGATPAISVNVTENFSIGASLAFLEGSTYDQEYKNTRGLLRLMRKPTGSGGYNHFALDSVYNHTETYAHSNYNGILGTIGVLFNQESYSFGFTMQPEWTLTRNWIRNVLTTTSSDQTTKIESGSEKLRLPFQYTVGIALHPTPKWTISIDFDTRKYGNVVYKPTTDTSYKPWLTNHTFRGGLEYKAAKWLLIRGGFREEAQTVAAEGAALLQNPTRGAVYSFGFGLNFKPVFFDFAYEYGHTKFEDMWLSNVNYNVKDKHEFSLETCIKF